MMKEKTKRLNGCFSENGEEIDEQEFEVETLKEFVELLKNGRNKEMHLNYFDSEEDLDLWIKIK